MVIATITRASMLILEAFIISLSEARGLNNFKTFFAPTELIALSAALPVAISPASTIAVKPITPTAGSNLRTVKNPIN